MVVKIDSFSYFGRLSILCKRSDSVVKQKNGQLQLIHHEEGRIIPEPDGTMTYQYHMKDHLSNVRLTFSANPGQYNYLATMETEYSAEEDQEFYNTQTRTTSIAANTTPGGNEAAMLNNNQPIGPGMQLSVGRADTIRAEVFAYYEDNSGFSSVFSPAEMIAAVAGSLGGSEGAAGEAGQVFDGINEAIGGLMGVGGSNGDNIPAAYLGYILLDQNYNFVDGGYQSISANANNNPELLTIAPIVVNQPGILYVYVSNESNSLNPVYFDDLKVTVSESPVLETTDYYPFGMTSESYQKPGMVDQKFKYNGKEELDDLGLNLIDYGARYYLHDIGRFFTQDRFSEKFNDYSPYHYVANNPIKYIDINGDSLWIKVDKKNRALYVDGQLFNQDGTQYTGKGIKIDKRGNQKLTGFLKSTVNNLDKISSGVEGDKMVNELQSSAKNVTIVNGTGQGNSYNTGSNQVKFDPSSANGGLNSQGSTARPTFIGLTHELAHGLDDIRGTVSTVKVAGTNRAEIFATHIENLVRGEQSVPIRVQYNSASPVVDNFGNSIYYGNT